MNLALTPADLGEVVIELYAKPGFGAAAECLGEPDGHFRGNAALAIQEVVQRLAPASARRVFFLLVDLAPHVLYPLEPYPVIREFALC